MASEAAKTRIAISLVALLIGWVVSGAAAGWKLGDPRAVFAFYLWSIPFFAAAWALMGIPIIALGNRVLRVPQIILGVWGAATGAMVIVAPALVVWTVSPGSGQHFNWSAFRDWSYWKGWPAFGAAIGAGVTIVYRWLLRWANSTQR